MAIWQPLGTVTPATDWQLFEIPVSTEIKTFRATFGGDLAHCWYHARFRQYFYAGDTGFSVRVYPRAGSSIFELQTPQDLVESGLFVRYIGIRKFANKRYTVIDGNWTVKLEQFIG